MNGPESGTARRHRVLVADDDVATRSAIRRGLRGFRLMVDDVADGASALSVLRTSKVDVLLLGACLPEHDGVAMLDAVRGDPVTETVQVVVVGAPEQADDILRCLEMGADDVLWAPVDPAALRARVAAGIVRAWLRERERECREQASLLAGALSVEAGCPVAARVGGTTTPFERLDGLLARADEQARLREEHLRRSTAAART